jgi:hypothetical protein
MQPTENSDMRAHSGFREYGHSQSASMDAKA